MTFETNWFRQKHLKFMVNCAVGARVLRGTDKKRVERICAFSLSDIVKSVCFILSFVKWETTTAIVGRSAQQQKQQQPQQN